MIAALSLQARICRFDFASASDAHLDAPLQFQPFLRPLVWGGRRLGAILNKTLPGDGPYGEAWEISDHVSHHSVVSGGPFRGQTLRHLLESRPEEILGPGAKSQVFPWLVKLLDAEDRLSVQVHPNDDAAARLWPGERGKTEAWFVLDAAPGSKIHAGLLPGVNEDTLRQALGAGRVADCLHEFAPRPGDCLFLPAGTVHAVGGGVLMAEVQQTSDATFRLFDWNRCDAQGRGRPLHVEQALQCIDWKRGPVRPIRTEGYPRTAASEIAGDATQRLVTCSFFTLDYLRRAAPFSVGAGRMQVVIALHGMGRLDCADGPFTLKAGDSLLLPASMAPLILHPLGSLGLLVAGLP